MNDSPLAPIINLSAYVCNFTCQECDDLSVYAILALFLFTPCPEENPRGGHMRPPLFYTNQRIRLSGR